MKRYVLFLLFLFIGLTSYGQTITPLDTTIKKTSILDRLQVHQPEAIKELVGVRLYGENIVVEEDKAYMKMSGFRTQVFSGNNQRLSKKEAFEKEEKIKELFPDLPTYITYVAPFWKLRVGDYRTHEEAFHTLHILKKAFPDFGKEMYIVKEDVKIRLN